MTFDHTSDTTRVPLSGGYGLPLIAHLETATSCTGEQADLRVLTAAPATVPYGSPIGIAVASLTRTLLERRVFMRSFG